MRYYRGRFAGRNDVMIRQITELMPDEAHIVDVAAGSSYIAEHLLQDDRVASYDWNDFNPKLQSLVRRRVQDERFTIYPFDLDADDYRLDQYNVLVGVSMEHLEKDLECVEKMPRGSIISVCSPDLIDPAHVRHFNCMSEMLERYEPYIDVKLSEEYKAGVTKFILTGYRK